jgi:hypothetical protein
MKKWSYENKSVYVMQAGEYCKIGISHRGETRKREIQIGTPVLISNEYFTELIANPHKVEKLVHNALKKYRSSGEWFRITFDEAVKTVKRLVAEHGNRKLIEIRPVDESGIKEIINTFYVPRERKEADVPVLNLDRWEPKESETGVIKAFVYESFKGSMEETDDFDLCKDQLALYNSIILDGIAACKKKIQSFFLDYYWSVDGNVYKYYKDDKALLSLMELTILATPDSAQTA